MKTAEYPLIVGVDLGTTNVRSIIFNVKGEIVGQAFRQLHVFNPRPGMAEENPEEIWRSTVETLKEAVKTSGISSDDVAALSFSSQMHGMTMTDRDGSPLIPLLTWLDQRATTQTEKLRDIMDPYELYRRTGCPLLFVYPLPKIMWAKENAPEKFARCHKILSAKDFVIHRMLGGPCIDRSVASGSQLLNIDRLDWDDEVLEVIGISEEKLPVLVDETEIIGELSGRTGRLTGLKKGTPVIAGASDGALSNIGLGAVVEGVAAMNIGTSGAMRVLTTKPFIDAHRHAYFFCYYAALGHWLPGGAVNNAGSVLRWFRDTLGQSEVEEAGRRGLDPYEVILEEAASVDPGSEGLILLPFFAGERFPIRDPAARGVLFGLRLAHGRAHVARTVLESVVYTLRWIMEILEEHGARIDEVRTGGGGARSSVWRQIQADVLGKTVVHTRVEEASALGAAMLAAISLDIYKDLGDASRSMVEVSSFHEPDIRNHRRYSSLFRIFKGLYSASRSFFEELTRLEDR